MKGDSILQVGRLPDLRFHLHQLPALTSALPVDAWWNFEKAELSCEYNSDTHLSSFPTHHILCLIGPEFATVDVCSLPLGPTLTGTFIWGWVTYPLGPSSRLESLNGQSRSLGEWGRDIRRMKASLTSGNGLGQIPSMHSAACIGLVYTACFEGLMLYPIGHQGQRHECLLLRQGKPL